MASVMPVRALVGAAALTTALGLSLVAPTGASAATVGTGTTVAATTLPTLRAGSSGILVTRVQGVLAIRRTGVFDRATVAAIKRLQAWKHVYPVNGVLGATTWRVLGDPTLGYALRTSTAARAKYPFTAWLGSVHGRGIAYRESHLSCTVLSRTHIYRGKWQMTLSLWRANGGLAFAAAPERASCLNQDKVAYRIWVRSGWRPWGG
jgi:hypothetical protein